MEQAVNITVSPRNSFIYCMPHSDVTGVLQKMSNEVTWERVIYRGRK